MYALVTADGFLLDTVDGPLDEAVAQARGMGAREVIFDESYDISDLFTREVQRLQRAANPRKELEKAAQQRASSEARRGLPRRLDLIADPGTLSADAQAALDSFEKTGKFPRGIKRSVAVEILREAEPAVRLQAAGVFSELDPRKAPAAAWAAVNRIRIDHDAVQGMTEEEAFEELRPIFADHESIRGAKTADRYSSHRKFFQSQRGEQSGMGLLTSNHKLLKGAAAGADIYPNRGAVHVMGLALLPHRLWQLGFGGKVPGRRGRSMSVVNTCIGASPECAQSCLVYSGRNTNQANDVKALRTDMLMRAPNAFARLLQTSIEFHVDDTRRMGRLERVKPVPFVRLNIFSDIPWELVWPELFEEFSDLEFYDYSKVPGRKPPSNYDLSFSWSGINGNNCEYEWKEGSGKVTIVFFKTPGDDPWPTHNYWRGQFAKQKKIQAGPFPDRFLGMKVIDGDMTDVRPYDRYSAEGVPKPWVIGLRYKPPAAQAFDPYRSLFVVPVEYWDGQIVAAVVPRDQPGVLETVLTEAARQAKLSASEKIALGWAQIKPEKTMTAEGRRRLKRRLAKP